MKTSDFMRDIYRKAPRLFLTNIFLLVFLGLIEAVSIFALAPVVDLFLNSNQANVSIVTRYAVAIVSFLGLPVTLGTFIAIFIIFNFFTGAAQVLLRNFVLKIKYSVMRELMMDSFGDFFRAKWYFFTSSKQGTLLNTFINEVNVIGDSLSAMGFFFTAFFQLILYLAIPFSISWQVALISVVVALLFAYPFFLLGKVNYNYGKKNILTSNQMSAVIQECFGMAKIIIGSGNYRKNIDGLSKAFDAHRQITVKAQTFRIGMPLMYYPVGLSALVIMLFVARQFALPLSATAVLLFSLLKIVPSIGKMTEWKNFLDSARPSYEQLMNLRSHARQLAQDFGLKPFNGFNKEITIENVSFAYPAHRPILEDINIVIPKGKMVALVGASGAGKTTLVDILLGFGQPVTGRIAIDGMPLKDFNIDLYRQKIGYVAQNMTLFNMTIKENLLWANGAATPADIEFACRQANANEFIDKFPMGYDTLVGDRGARLSGGQVQRVALAMAMVRKPEILILDEATSSLDGHSEKLIQEAIEKIAKDATVVVVAHRLATIKHSDYVYLLENGRIIEQGGFEELASRNGTKFKQMCEVQNIL